jgi:hypothetical protein
MATCTRCNQDITPHDHAVRRRPKGSPGLHVRRHLCACGCKFVEFYVVMDVSKMRSSHLKPGAHSALPLYDYPIFKDANHVGHA